MAGPWEQYSSSGPASSGPWANYASNTGASRAPIPLDPQNDTSQRVRFDSSPVGVPISSNGHYSPRTASEYQALPQGATYNSNDGTIRAKADMSPQDPLAQSFGTGDPTLESLALSNSRQSDAPASPANLIPTQSEDVIPKTGADLVNASFQQQHPVVSQAGVEAQNFAAAYGADVGAGLLNAQRAGELLAGGVAANATNSPNSFSDALFKASQEAGQTSGALSQAAAQASKPGAIAGSLVGAAPTLLAGGPVAYGAEAALNKGADVSDKGGSLTDALKAAETSGLTNAALASLPMAARGPLLTRLVTGGAIGAGVGPAGQEVQHLVSPKYEQAPTAKDIMQGGLVGALMGGVGVESAPYRSNEATGYQFNGVDTAEPQPSPKASPAPTETMGAETPPAAQVPKAGPTTLAETAFKQDPKTALASLDHATLVQVAQDAGLDVKHTDSHADIVNKVVATGPQYLQSDVLPEYLSAVKPQAGATPPLTAGVAGNQPAATTPRQFIGDANGNVLEVPPGTQPDQQPVLSDLSQALHAGVAQNTSANPATADEGQLSQLRQGVPGKGSDFAQALQDLRKPGESTSHLELPASSGRGVDLPPMPARSDVSDELATQSTDDSPPWWLAGQREQEAHEAGIRSLKAKVPDAPMPLSPATPVDTSHDVTLGGGVAKDNSTIYIDRGIPEYIAVPKQDGSGDAMVNVHKDIAFHEAAEKPELDQGTHYFQAHEQNANSAEDGYLREKYGVTRAAVDEALKPYLEQAAAKNPETAKIPSDLDRKPYEDGGDTDMLPEVSNQLAKIGIPEELHPQALEFLNHVNAALDAGIPSRQLRDIALGDGELHEKLNQIDQLIGESGHAHIGDTKSQEVQGQATAPAPREAGQTRVAQTLPSGAEANGDQPGAGSGQVPAGQVAEGRARTADQQPVRGQDDVSHGSDQLENNASGESSASLEAQHRLADEKAAGQTRAVIRRDGTIEPLTGVDAVDTHARNGEVIVQHGIGKEPWTILSHGNDLSRDVAAGKLNRAKNALEDLRLGASKKSEDEPEEKVGNTYDLNLGSENEHTPLVSLSAVRGALAERGMSDDQIKAMSADQLRSEQANLRRRSAPAPEEVQAGTTTGIKDATVEEERAMKGKAAVEHDLSRSNPTAFAEAKRRLAADPEYGTKLANSIIDRPRPHTQEEAMALSLDRMRIINDRRSAYDDLQESRKGNDQTGEAAQRVRINILDSQMEANDKAAEFSGHETGAALQARRVMTKDDYSMAAMVNQGKKLAGRDLRGPEREALEQRALEIEKREKALAEREKALQDAKREPRKPTERQAAKAKFDSLAEKLKAIAQKDQMKPGCVS